MAYGDSSSSVRQTAGTIATVWIIVIVVLVVVGVVGCIVSVWMWRRHVKRRRQRMDAFYATPIQNGPQQQQYPNYNYQQVQPKQELPQQPRQQHPVSEIYTPGTPQPPPPVAQLDGQHTEVGSISHRSSYSPLPAQLGAQPTGVSNVSDHNNHNTNNNNNNNHNTNNNNNNNNQPPSELP